MSSDLLVQVKAAEPIEVRAVPEASHLRELAEQCLAIARELSDIKAANGLRKRPAEYSAQAEELEIGKRQRNA